MFAAGLSLEGSRADLGCSQCTLRVLNGILTCSVFQKLGVPLMGVLITRIIFYSSYERGL